VCPSGIEISAMMDELAELELTAAKAAQQI